MKQTRISRRGFLKLSAFGTSAIAASAALASVAATAPLEAQAAAQQPQRLALPQPSFNAIASTTVFGAPADIAAGWDGTLWATDASGAPHLYDSTQNAWLAHGDPLSGACWLGTTYYWFKGSEVVTAPFGGSISAPQTIAAAFPKIPDSFKLSLVGAANVAGVLVLFNGGRYAPADGTTAPVNLTTLANWPQTAAWADGVIDAVHSDGTSNVLLLNGAQFITANLQTKTVTSAPAALSSYAPWQNRLPTDWATSGVDAGFTLNGSAVLYKATTVISFSMPGSGIAAQQYIGAVNATWPATWHPVLNHAPAGRMGNLWAATKSGGVVQHDGETWSVKDNTGNGVTHVAVGQDNSAFLCGIHSQTLWQWNGAAWTTIATAGVTLSQVAVGDAGHVFVRGTDNSVHQLGTGNALTAVNLGAGVPPPTHITANADGTLWHCTSGTPNAFRLITEVANPSAPLQLKGAGLVTSVQKVASTGFGAAHCLAEHSDGSINVYRYDSPYVFKTAQTYSIANSLAVVEQGLGHLYMTIVVINSNATPEYYVVALDAHTGVEVARSAKATAPLRYTNPVFDAINDLVYVGTLSDLSSDDLTTPGQLIALDARTLQPRWTFASTQLRSIDATPMVSGAQLCFGDRTGTIYRFDTRAALANATAVPSIAPQPTWTWTVPTSAAIIHRVTTPVSVNGQIYAAVWDISPVSPSTQIREMWWAYCNARDGSDPKVFSLLGPNLYSTEFNFISSAPVPGQVLNGEPPGYEAGFFINGGNVILGHTENGNGQFFALPAGRTISTGITYDAVTGTVWFGDDHGTLYALNKVFQPVNYTPFDAVPSPLSSMSTTPVLYRDPTGGLTVLFGIDNTNGNGDGTNLFGFDPDNGNLASIPTGATVIGGLSKTATNGMVYAAGVPGTNVAGTAPQAFGIRVDALPQALRDFVIESQLMQDPDPNATGGDPANSVPPSVARYQTHLTVVDDQKNPLVHESLKIWADTPNTAITIDGVAFTIGPDDAGYASIKTGSDGSLVMTLNATDYFAPTLRVWASFMDPFERIVVHPDQEFQVRVTTAHANASDSDPDKVNLITAANYNGKPLFTDDEKNADPPAPDNVAKSIQTANTGLGLTKNSSRNLYRKMMRAVGARHKNQRMRVTVIDAGIQASPQTAPQPDKYMAYADLPGATHFPTNVPSARLAEIAQPIGLSYSRPNGDITQAPVFTAMSHTDARAAIDALEGEAWKPTDPQGGLRKTNGRPMQTFNIFQDFWNWLKGLFDKIAQCILSIAEDILAAVQYVVDGILKVFKAILEVLADIFPFLGSFFKMLEKAIDDVVAALSVLMHFGEIVWTHRWLAGQFQTQVQQLATTIQTQAMPQVQQFFTRGEDAVKTAFDNIRKSLGASDSVNSVKGMGATPHTIFTVKPGAVGRPGAAGPNSGGTSHATQCTWGIQKFKTGSASASYSTPSVNMGSASARPSAPMDDPLSAFFTEFVARLDNDADLGSIFGQLKTDFGNLFHVSSAKQFFSTLLTTLLDIVEAVVIGVMAVGEAFVEGILSATQAAIDAILAVLNYEIEIPVITWLYEQLFGEKLTFLNLATLVAAIPVTVLFRVIEGQYPSQAGLPAALSVAATEHTGQTATAAPKVAQQVLGTFTGVFAIVQGICNGIGDSQGSDAPKFTGVLSAGLGLLITAFTVPAIASDTPSTEDWLTFGVSAAWALSGALALPAFELADADVLPWCNSFMGLLVLICTIIAFVEDGNTDILSDFAFAGGLASAVPGMLNALTLAPEPVPAVVGIVDGVGGLVSGVIDIIVAFASTETVSLVYRLHIPTVHTGPSQWPYELNMLP